MPAKKSSPEKVKVKKLRALYSTSEGRQKMADLLQQTYGDKAVIGFDRYGRYLGALVPIEAVQMLAGEGDRIEDDVKERIRRSSLYLLQKMKKKDKYSQLSFEREDVMTLEEIDELYVATEDN